MTVCLLLNATKVIAVDTVTLHADNNWHQIFAGKETYLHLSIESKARFSGRLNWSLQAHGRSLARGAQSLNTKRGDASFSLAITAPLVKPGVTVQAALQIELRGSDSEGAVATLLLPITIHSSQPLNEKVIWLNSLNLHLFDPAGKTAEMLRSSGITFNQHMRVDTLQGLSGATILVGEGIALDSLYNLNQSLLSLAANGNSLLLLSPSSGGLQLVGSNGAAQPDSIHFDSTPLTGKHQLTNHCDNWPDIGGSSNGLITLTNIRDHINATFSNHGIEGWPWLRLNFTHPYGTLAVTRCPIMQAWQLSPTPQLLFYDLLAAIIETDQ